MATKKDKKSKTKKITKSGNYDKMEKFSLNNINKPLDFIRYTFIFWIFYFIIGILFVGSILYYLNKLKTCQCFIERNKKNHSNIEFLIIVEGVILALFIFGFLTSLFVLYSVKSGGNYGNYIIYGLIVLFLIIFVQSYFIYNVYKLSQNIDEKCECAKSWIRYLLYIQTFFIITSLISLIINISQIFLK